MCNTCNTTNTIATNTNCNPYNGYNYCFNRLLNCLFGNSVWGCGGCANTANNGCVNTANNGGCGQCGSQRVCRDCCGNLRVYSISNGNGCGCWNNGCSNAYSNGCPYSHNHCCHSCGVCAQTFATTQTTAINGDEYYANQYGLNGRSNRCGCSCQVNYGV